MRLELHSSTYKSVMTVEVNNAEILGDDSAISYHGLYFAKNGSLWEEVDTPAVEEKTIYNIAFREAIAIVTARSTDELPPTATQSEMGEREEPSD